MQRPANYHTKQSKAILACLASLGQRHATASQVAVHSARRGTPIGIATIYRHGMDLPGVEAFFYKRVARGSGTPCDTDRPQASGKGLK